jgi:hypothetical protein
MYDAIAPVVVMALIGYFTLALVRLVSENRLRHKLIEKGLVDEKIKLLFADPPSATDGSLKWGMVLIAVGGAFLLAFAVHKWVPAGMREELTAGMVFLMAGLGLIVYYAIARGREGKDR